MPKKRTQPRKVCVIETADSFYKVMRVSKYFSLVEEFLLTRFSLGHIASNKAEMQQDILELQIKESELYDIIPDAIEIVYCKVSKRLKELCEVDIDGMITAYKLFPSDDWEDAPEMKRKKNIATPFYDIVKLEKILQRALAEIVIDELLTIDFYALGKTYGLSDIKPITGILESIEQAENILNEELDANDFELYGDDIDYQSGIIAGSSKLLDILKNAPVLEKEIEIRYIFLIDIDSAWDKLIKKKDEWVHIPFFEAKNITAFAIVTSDAQKAYAMFVEYDSEYTKLIALYQKGERIPQHITENNETVAQWKLGKITKSTATEQQFWKSVKADIIFEYSFARYVSDKKSTVQKF